MLELNSIYNIDCVEGLKQLDNNSIDLIITDPPYLIENTKAGGKSELAKSIQHMNDELSSNNTTASISSTIKAKSGSNEKEFVKVENILNKAELTIKVS